jgi:hypothetical protein
MADIPDRIVLKRDRELDGRSHEIWIRRGLFSLLLVIPILALLNVFGQRPATSSAATGAAKLVVYSPTRVRSGLLFEARFRIEARRTLQNAALVLDPGWLEGMTMNSMAPSPNEQTSENGLLRLDLGKIEAGRKYRLFIYFQVNPTNVGHRSQVVELDDGSHRLMSIHRTITIFP